MANVTQSDQIQGVVIVEPKVFGDSRGQFVETFRKEWVPEANEMIQANRADRQAGALVGLHYHRFQADFWYVPFGKALVALHDLRQSSPTDGTTLTLELSQDNHIGLYIPPGVAHGFLALEPMTITYLVDGYYNPADELGVAWDDPALAISWPISDPVLSERDQNNPKRSEISAELRPV
jgi:dTDP-4-dehydrorhamnose 3,5-epimerase